VGARAADAGGEAKIRAFRSVPVHASTQAMVARPAALQLATVVATLLVGVVAFAPAAQAASCPAARSVPSAGSMGAATAATLCLLNAERGARGLAPLVSQPLLEDPATGYSLAMVQQRFFDHVSPDGQVLAQRLAGYLLKAQGWSIGENLGWGEGHYATPAAIVAQWMNSDGHRVNILNPSFREIGIGIVNGSPAGSDPGSSATYTTNFGSRLVGGLLPEIRLDLAGPSTSPTMASSAASNPAAASPKRVSAATKRRIKAQCTSQARRTKSRSARARRISRCVASRLPAARR